MTLVTALVQSIMYHTVLYGTVTTVNRVTGRRNFSRLVRARLPHRLRLVPQPHLREPGGT